MNALLEAVDAIAVHFGVLVLGVTIVLAVGCVAVTFARRPGERRRLGGLCAGAVALYLAVAVVPLPRWAPDAVEPAPRTVAAASERIERLLAATADLVAVPDPADRVATPSSPDPTIAAAVPALVPAVPAPIVAAAPWPWARLAVGSWLVLAAAMALRACVGFARLFRLLRASRPVADAELAGVEVPRGVRVRGVERAVRPFCAWCGRSVVVVPVSLLAPECRSQLRSVLRHELAHVRAGDPALQLLLTALAVPLAAHPLLWWLARDVRFHAELLADDAAAAATGRERYARDLLDLAERAEPELAAAGTVPVFHRPSEFFRRIQMLLQREGRLSAPVSLVRRSVQTLAAFALVGVAAATLGVPAAAQEPHRRELVAQNDALRAQIDALHTELANLRALLDEHKQKQARDQVPAAVPSPNAHSGSDGATPDGNEALRVLDQLARVGDKRPTTEEAHAAIRALQRLAEGPRTDADADPVRVNELLEKAAASADANSTEAQDAKRVVLPEMYRRYYDQYLKAFPARLPVPGSANADPQPAPRARTSADDVAELVSRCLDLRGDLEVAEMEAAEAKAHHEAGVVTGLEHKRVQMKFSTLQRKYAAVRVLVHGEIEATQQDIAELAARAEEAGVAAQLARAKARLDALQAAN